MREKPAFPAHISRFWEAWPERRNGWLPWEGSNSEIPDYTSSFEIIGEFPPKVAVCALETFQAFRSPIGSSETPASSL